MKIVQSLWSKPGTDVEFSEKNKCGWSGKKYNYFSWALSCLQLKKYYSEIELVTDQQGEDLLINKLELPYTNTINVLDQINGYHHGLFALGKIYAYGIQTKPFIHVDSDVFIWEKFNDRLEKAPLLCQSKEEGEFYNRYYSNVFYSMLKSFVFFPNAFDSSITKNNGIQAINAGIIGGINLEFFANFSKKAFEFIDKNIDHIKKIDVHQSNMIFEQFLFRALAEQGEIPIQYLSVGDTFLTDILDFTGVPSKRKYIHIYSGHKQVSYFLDCLEYRLQRDYPKYYYRIIHLLKTSQI
jgi:hypothetical protein